MDGNNSATVSEVEIFRFQRISTALGSDLFSANRGRIWWPTQVSHVPEISMFPLDFPPEILRKEVFSRDRYWIHSVSLHYEVNPRGATFFMRCGAYCPIIAAEPRSQVTFPAHGVRRKQPFVQ